MRQGLNVDASAVEQLFKCMDEWMKSWLVGNWLLSYMNGLFVYGVGWLIGWLIDLVNGCSVS